MMSRSVRSAWATVVICALVGCDFAVDPPSEGDGPIAEGITARMGEPLPSATPEQLEAFQRGRDVFSKRFDLSDGLGPAFNVTFCGACHERPVAGGSAGLYRNFFLAGRLDSFGSFVPSESAGMTGGVLRVFQYGGTGVQRPPVPETTTIFAQRNPIPMFGSGLIAELSAEEILARADENDANGDGISGRPNLEDGVVSRFGRKAQTNSLEGFTRGPLLNHLGVTTTPLTAAQRGQLPMSVSPGATASASKAQSSTKSGPSAQVVVEAGPNTDSDDVSDPEMSNQDLFDLVTFVMLLAPPQFDAPTAESERGRLAFHEANCSACHVPRLMSPRGPLPVYSDLLLHDMGDDLADGIQQGEATGSEFRTQPLWGLAAVGPYLHDGRADDVHEAIMAHGGESANSRDVYASFSSEKQSDVEAFLLSLGGRDQFSPGLLPPDTPITEVGAYGGPFRELSPEEAARFENGRGVFDRDFGYTTGVGALTGPDLGPRFNADSCRACHFDPVIGGAGPRGVNVIRYGTISVDGQFIPPAATPNTILHKEILVGFPLPQATSEINVFEQRQTPSILGLGLVEAISDETILANADPNDLDNDGISGRARILEDGRLGRFGWKAQVPSLDEFVRDAMAAEIGLTVAPQEGLSFGITTDDDGVADPELSVEDAEDLTFFLASLAPPPGDTSGSAESLALGESLFDEVGCAKCHVPSLPSPLGDVTLYSDLLLHDILAEGTAGIADGTATQTEFRTAPLWGIADTAPYFHTGEADTLHEAIMLHDGEAASVRNNYAGLTESDQQALIAWLSSL